MGDNFIIEVCDCFDLDAMINELVEKYQAQGYEVTVIRMKKSVKLVFSKDLGGINTVLGLGVGIAATFTLTGETNKSLSVVFSEQEWVSKIVGGAIGLCVCTITLITAAVGLYRQLNLPTQIKNDVQVLSNEQTP